MIAKIGYAGGLVSSVVRFALEVTVAHLSATIQIDSQILSGGESDTVLLVSETIYLIYEVCLFSTCD